jgi:hypothetical protein
MPKFSRRKGKRGHSLGKKKMGKTRKLRGGVVDDASFTANTITAFNTAMNEANGIDQERSKVGILKRISESRAYINRLLYLSTKELASQIIRQLKTGAPAITGLAAGNEILKDYTQAGGAAAVHEQEPTPNGVALALQTFIDNCDQAFAGGGGGIDFAAIKLAYTALIGRMKLIYAEYLKIAAPRHAALIGPNTVSVDNWGDIHSAITVALVGSNANDESRINAAVTAVIMNEDRLIGEQVINPNIQGTKRNNIQTIIDNKLYDMTNKYIGIRTIIGFFDVATISAFRVHIKLLHAYYNFEISYFNLLQNISTLGVVGAPSTGGFGGFSSFGGASSTGGVSSFGGGAGAPFTRVNPFAPAFTATGGAATGGAATAAPLASTAAPSASTAAPLASTAAPLAGATKSPRPLPRQPPKGPLAQNTAPQQRRTSASL